MTETALQQLRKIGALWLFLAPVGWLMAAISSVRDDTVYRIQLGVFTAGAVAAIVFGVAAVCRQTWSRTGLVVLSWLAALIFLGPGLFLTITALFSPRPEATVMGVAIAIWGVPFGVMALRLQRLKF